MIGIDAYAERHLHTNIGAITAGPVIVTGTIDEATMFDVIVKQERHETEAPKEE